MKIDSLLLFVNHYALEIFGREQFHLQDLLQNCEVEVFLCSKILFSRIEFFASSKIEGLYDVKD